MSLYKVVLKGSFQGQAITNILYYRNGIGVDIGGLTIGGTKEVADAVKAMVWPVLKTLMHNDFEMQQIDSYAYNDETFDLLYQNPYTVGVQEHGTYGSINMNGPAPCAIMKFILESHIIVVNGPKPPKRGYLAIGPLADQMVLNDGALNLTGDDDTKWNLLCAVCSNNVETILPIPAVFY